MIIALDRCLILFMHLRIGNNLPNEIFDDKLITKVIVYNEIVGLLLLSTFSPNKIIHKVFEDYNIS